MSGVNKVILVGRLGNDPEVRYTNSGKAVAKLSIATSENWADKEGQRQERTEWHRIVVWGKLGELCGEYLKKGRQVFIEGRLQTRSWEDKEGQKKYTTEIVAQNIQFLGGRSENGQTQDTVEASSETPPPNAAAFDPAATPAAYGATDDDIPF